MPTVLTLPDRMLRRVDAALGEVILGTAARLIFAGVLLMYFWKSALTKLGDGIMGLFAPSTSAYVQIFPKAVEAASYDISQLSLFHWAVALAGTWAEFVLPALIVLGLFTRLAALGMIAFIVVQSIVDITGHNAAPADIGGWFDGASGALIADQRALWLFLLICLVVKGGGPLALDKVLAARA
jgi:putative oxidoreductase